MPAFLSKIALSTVVASSLAFAFPSTSVYVRPDAPPQETIVAEITSYNSEPGQTDDTPFITASGTHVHDGTIACPQRYAFGTVVRIEGKDYTCEDRMNPKFPDRFDVWLPSKEQSIEWGVRTLEVIIL